MKSIIARLLSFHLAKSYFSDGLLEAVDDANSHVVVMPPASPSIDIQSGISGVEVTRFESAAQVCQTHTSNPAPN
jgi:hypothetical protein